ncbi:MAG: ABC transporter substrate-binding protein, partial [Pseudorhodoplanes sp.]
MSITSGHFPAITRRQLGAGAAALGLAGLQAEKVFAQTPKRGGRLKIALNDHRSADTLDPRKQTLVIDHVRVLSILNTLVRLNDKLLPEAELATSWESTPDAKTWNFKLRPGVEFHNGKKLTAQDVIYSLNLHRKPNTAVMQTLLAGIKDIKADGDGIRIEMETADPDMPMTLATFNFGIVPDGFTEFEKLVGTGPFKFQSFQPGVRMVATRNPNYWKNGLPYVDELETYGIPNAQARLNALLAGDVHFMHRIDARQVPAIESSGVAEVAAAKSGRHVTIQMLCNSAPFEGNVDLRKAFKYAIDREGILKNIRKGYATIANDQYISPYDPMFDKSVPQYTYDPDKAKFHLKKAGHDKFDIVLRTSDAVSSDAVDIALHYQQSAAKCGINLDIKREPVDGYWANIWMKAPFSMSTGLPRSTAGLAMSTYMVSDARWNECKYNNPKLDALVKEANSITDAARRRQLYGEVQRIFSD